MRLHFSELILTLQFILLAAVGAAAHAQTDLSLSGYGAFGKTTNTTVTGNTTFTESPSNSAGGMIELRHKDNPLVGYEATYSFNRANQVYLGNCTFCEPVVVSADAHEITGDWLFSAHAANLRPFALAGIGLLLTEPTSGQSATTGSHTVAYVYGAGIDWGLLSHFGMRLQYRGSIHRASDITTVYGASALAFTHTAKPMIGVYYEF